MSEQLVVQAVGSYFRTNAPNPQVIAEVRLALGVRVHDLAGEPVTGLTAGNFMVKLSGQTATVLGAFTVTESPDPAQFPGFYHLSLLHTPKTGTLSIDWALTLGMILCLKVTRSLPHTVTQVGTSVVALNALVGDSGP